MPRPAPPFLPLSLPLAAIGLVAGWAGAGFLEPSPRLGPRLGAALAVAFLGYATGAALQRDADPSAARSLSSARIRFALTVIIGSASAGALVPPAAGYAAMHLSALAGLAASAVLLPLCALLLEAARRAARARPGSLVARAERRGFWLIAGAALAATSLGALRDWARSHPLDGRAVAPLLPLAAATLGAVAALVILILDATAYSRVRRLERAGGEAPGGAQPDAAAEDLEIVEEAVIVEERPVHPYRGLRRRVSRRVGSAFAALSALRIARVRAAIGVAIACASVGAHAMARDPAGQLAYQRRACDFDLDGPSCRAAAQMMVEAGQASPRRLRELYRHGCWGGDRLSCAEGEHLDLLEAEAVQGTYERSCRGGDGASCWAFARWAYFGGGRASPSARGLAQEMLRLGCKAGHAGSCWDLKEIRLGER